MSNDIKRRIIILKAKQYMDGKTKEGRKKYLKYHVWEIRYFGSQKDKQNLENVLKKYYKEKNLNHIELVSG